jgi:hypothetical protein
MQKSNAFVREKWKKQTTEYLLAYISRTSYVYMTYKGVNDHFIFACVDFLSTLMKKDKRLDFAYKFSNR